MSDRGVGPKEIGPNMCAFLDMIAHAEGTDRYPCEGYQAIVGGAQFTDYSTHPKTRVWFTHYRVWSTAAGRYQLLYRYFLAYSKLLHLHDFSPRSQDLIAIQMIREQGAYKLVRAGRICDAILKCSNIWASFPGAGYGQREADMRELVAIYNKAREHYEAHY